VLDAIYGVDGLELDLAFLAFPNARLELIAVHRPQGAANVPAPVDLGAGHLCIEVDDVMNAWRDLSGRGVVFAGEPMVVEEGPAKGLAMAIFEDPDGNRIELIQPPR
jgi:catechol 2,3-dioxygenase-like lactoylglutathione lyase family enzyme